jgi:hypothetical protein
MERADIGDLLVGQPRYRKDPNQRWSKQNTFRLFLGDLLLPISGRECRQGGREEVEKPAHQFAGVNMHQPANQENPDAQNAIFKVVPLRTRLMTPFELAIQVELAVEWQRFNNEWLFPWHNLNIEGRIVDVPNFQGAGRITIGGVLFQGQQQDIYWQAIARYLNQKIHEVFRRWDTETSSYPNNFRSNSLDAVENLLRQFVAKIVSLANDTAGRLKGRGFPQNAMPFNSSGYHSGANAEILRLGEAHRLLMVGKAENVGPQTEKQTPSKWIEKFYTEKKGLIYFSGVLITAALSGWKYFFG